MEYNTCGNGDYDCLGMHGSCKKHTNSGPCQKPKHHKGPCGKSNIRLMSDMKGEVIDLGHDGLTLEFG